MTQPKNNQFEPAFEVTRVNSMQWNRTIQVKALEQFQEQLDKNQRITVTTEVSPETLEQVRTAIRKEIAEMKGEGREESERR